jgi:hypothetical protein
MLTVPGRTLRAWASWVSAPSLPFTRESGTLTSMKLPYGWFCVHGRVARTHSLWQAEGHTGVDVLVVVVIRQQQRVVTTREQVAQTADTGAAPAALRPLPRPFHVSALAPYPSPPTPEISTVPHRHRGAPLLDQCRGRRYPSRESGTHAHATTQHEVEQMSVKASQINCKHANLAVFCHGMLQLVRTSQDREHHTRQRVRRMVRECWQSGEWSSEGVTEV